MKDIKLQSNWTLYYRPQEDEEFATSSELSKSGIPNVKAEVPGNCELDLINAGLLPKDILFGLNIMEVQKYEYHEWWYSTSFEYKKESSSNKVCLHFEAVDCYADYYVNGIKIGHSENAYIPHEFEVTNILKESNDLVVHIKSALAESHKHSSLPMADIVSVPPRIPFQTIRKPAHSFGWDIMPRCMASGIWRDVSLRSYSDAEIANVFPYTLNLTKDYADVVFAWHIDFNQKYYHNKMRFYAHIKCEDSEYENSTTCFTNTGLLHIRVENPKLWFPRNYGESNIYDVEYFVKDEINNVVLAKMNSTFGIRKVELDRTDVCDGKNGKFEFIINGIKVFANGTNWIPLDPFHANDIKRLPEALDALYDSGANMVRIWGGGVYENKMFYEYCDRHGIMIWQDFMMACNMYPQEDWFYEIMKEEAKVAVEMLRHHPSIVLWCGDNECDGYYMENGLSPSENKITRNIIPDMLKYCDPGRPYIPSSPYFSEEAYQKCYVTKEMTNYECMPENHMWGPRNFWRSEFYRDSVPCFISEEGYYTTGTKESLELFIPKENLWPYTNPEWVLHSTCENLKNTGLVDVIARNTKETFGEIPDNLDDFTHASTYVQAEAFKYFIEKQRGNRPYTTGVLHWNLIDGWPGVSNGLVDYYFNKRMSYVYAKRVSLPHIIMIKQTDSNTVEVLSSNISLNSYKGKYKVFNPDTNQVLSEGEYQSQSNENYVIDTVKLENSDNRLLLIEWSDDNGNHKNHYLFGNPPFDLNQYRKWDILINE